MSMTLTIPEEHCQNSAYVSYVNIMDTAAHNAHTN